MINYKQDGKVLKVTAPAALTSGEGFAVGTATDKIVLFPVADADSGAEAACMAEGVLDLDKQAADDFVLGEPVFWDDTNKRVEKSAIGMIPLGFAAETTPASATKCEVKLAGQPGTVVT